MTLDRHWIAGYENTNGSFLERQKEQDWEDAVEFLMDRLEVDEMVARDTEDAPRFAEVFTVIDRADDCEVIDETVAGHRYFVMDVDDFLADDRTRSTLAVGEAVDEFTDAIELTQLDQSLDETGDDIGWEL